MKQRYTPSMTIIPDREVVFQLREDGRLDDAVRARTEKEAFYRTMNYMRPRFKLRPDEEANVIRVYHREGRTARLSRDLSTPIDKVDWLLTFMPQGILEVITFLAKANNTNYECAAKAYWQTAGDYEAATRLLEGKKGFAPEAEWERSEESVENRVRMQERDDAVELIEEWADPEIVAANVFQGTDEKDLVPRLEEQH